MMELLFWLSPIIAVVLAAIAYYRDPDILPAIGIAAFIYLAGLLGLYFGVRYSRTTDVETWTAFAQTVSMKEGWTEVCTRTVTDSKGNTRTETYTVQHDPEWHVRDDSDNTVSITPDRYAALARRWGHDPHTTDWNLGRTFSYKWDGSEAACEVVSTKHRFENRVQASNSIFRRQPLSKRELAECGVHEYHPVAGSYDCPSVYGVFPGYKSLEQRISKFNARYGKEKQVRVHILVWRDESVEAAVLQERHWGNGKKNELNVCIGLEQDRIAWVQVFSWCEREDLKAELRNDLEMLGKFDDSKVADAVEKAVLAKWERKHFHDFDYLHVELPARAVFLAYVWAFAWAALIPIAGNALNRAGPYRPIRFRR